MTWIFPVSHYGVKKIAFEFFEIFNSYKNKIVWKRNQIVENLDANF